MIVYRIISKYNDTEKWAAVTISGTRESDTFDAYYDQQKCMKGDQISVGPLTLLVTDIKNDGTVSFSVENGELIDDAGNTIWSDVLTPGEQKDYQSGNDRFMMWVRNYGIEKR